MKKATVLISILAAGCAANPENVSQVAEAEAERLQPPSRQLSNYSRFDLRPMTFIDEIRAEEGKLEEAREFEQNYRDTVAPLLAQWEASGSGTRGTLVVESELNGLRIVSGGARFWAGAFAGDSFIDMDLRLVEESTGDTIANVRITRDADSMAGAWSIGRSDQNLDDYIVNIVHEYLSENY